MNVITFDETEKFIVKGAIKNVRLEDREQAIFEYLEGNLENPDLKNSKDGENLYEVLNQLYTKLMTSDADLTEVLKGDFSSVFDEN